MEQLIQKLNALNGVYTFTAMGLEDYVTVSRAGKMVATYRFVNEDMTFAIGGSEMQDVREFLVRNQVHVY